MSLGLYLVGGVAAGLGVMLVVLSLLSRRPPALGLTDGRLTPCPGTPNCVTSEAGAIDAVGPLDFQGPADAAWDRARAAITALGGRIVADQGDYLRAVFTSPVLRFADDLELRLDRQGRVIHVRSAARVGHWDLGVNRRRVRALKSRFRGCPGTNR
ncbi:MAG TPA: DUF1499 domain-containing protein [Gammaproteobacteria bacterium]|nr:DUF1499 domain-containing protein [Gammaproteobacteria bacterium]